MPVPARLNPFAIERVHQVRYRRTGFDWDEFLRRIEEASYRSAIVGPEGSGKTTLQIELAERLESQGFSIKWIRLSRTERIIPNEMKNELDEQLRSNDIIMFDGLEQLAWWRWQAFKKQYLNRAKGIIATVHKPSRLPTVWTCHADVALLKEIVDELHPGIDEPLLKKLFNKHDGNIRLCLRELYDMAARGGL